MMSAKEEEDIIIEDIDPASEYEADSDDTWNTMQW